ncbi:Endonuclease [Citrus sinensis]|uniref:Endonuclease n=1 Tax=Citrus sinensis TaxID=2711 RepID=A0ACB8JQP9_CITSI|nr:Endonuclease [Citrus sinensis]
MSKNGISVDPSKVEAVSQLSRPTNTREVRSFLGLVGYYRRFVEGFSKIATLLTKKNVKFVWTPECKESFEELKRQLVTTPILAIPDNSKGYIIYSDVSKSGIECVLMQNGKVIAYASRQLKDYEKNYPLHDLELAAVVLALKIWHHNLMGAHCKIYTDHKSLKYFFTQKELNMRQWQRLELVKDYNYCEINYYPGKVNMVAVALSRKLSPSALRILLKPLQNDICKVYFTFWEKLHNAMGTKLKISTSFHPQTDGQSERTIQTLEEMLRGCAINFQGSWSKYLPLAKFDYNNSYQATIGMTPYEALYGRKCRSPIHWDEMGERRHLGLDLITASSEAIEKIRQRNQAAQSRQKSYADKRRRPLEFQVGVAPIKGLMRFGNKGKFCPYKRINEIWEQRKIKSEVYWAI